MSNTIFIINWVIILRFIILSSYHFNLVALFTNDSSRWRFIGESNSTNWILPSLKLSNQPESSHCSSITSLKAISSLTFMTVYISGCSVATDDGQVAKRSKFFLSKISNFAISTGYYSKILNQFIRNHQSLTILVY